MHTRARLACRAAWILAALVALVFSHSSVRAQIPCKSPIKVISWATPPGASQKQFTGEAYYTGSHFGHAHYEARVASTDGDWVAYGFMDFSLVECQFLSTRTFYTMPASNIYDFQRIGGDEEGCEGGGSTELVENVEYGGYDPFESQVSNGGCGSSGGGGDPGTGGGNCHTEWVVIEISYDGGNTWQTYWEGTATVCE
jgi:hypothetical protein